MSVARFVPKFGIHPHVPAACNEPDANPTPKRRKKADAACVGCGGEIKVGSAFVCMCCHRVAPDAVPQALRHSLPSLKQDRRLAPTKAFGRTKVKPEPWVSPWLTKKEAEAMMADAKRGDQPIEAVEAFLASQAS